MRVAWLCDFDGTVSPADIGAAFVRRFSPGAAPARRALLADWLAGRLGHRELTRRECALVRADAEAALAFTRGFALDPGFAPFVRAARAGGDAVEVVSEGLDFYVRDLLARAGLDDLPWSANRAVFGRGRRVRAEFPFADPACDACGNCKAGHVRRRRAAGWFTVLVGDGASDRHGALVADAVLARGPLEAWCRAEGVPHQAFTDFADLAAHAAGRVAALAAGAAPRRPRARRASGA